MIVSTPLTFSSANLIEYLVSTVDGTMSLKELNSSKVRLLSTRFHVLALITSFALTSGPSEVLPVRESHNLRDSNSLIGFTGQGRKSSFLIIILEGVRVPASFYLPNTVHTVQIWTITLVMSWLSTLLIVIALHSAWPSVA
ncbi:hypothetical protein Tco_1236394 [Tanacetum coccineum]